ncbi:acetylglutamate kinase [Silvanigrella paludirubra]|uniref:Acetylglutamate kinase n=1 Tax=Silvanigrella paludirubra TaxID=2499159 RepID=A0A6N6VX48_9BACT|nr:acetylglutamate kinase [Silvanigrella paludirubra]KAB8040891.1 acetylglutamate kinase [Silvanigrella paludirubra]
MNTYPSAYEKNIIIKSKDLKGNIFVIKCGGSLLSNKIYLDQIIKEISQMYHLGIKIILIHGGGNEINDISKKFHISPKFLNGQRITDKETMEIVQLSLHGKTNRNIISCFNKYNVNSVGMSGQDSNTIEANIRDEKLGYVGNITHVNLNLIEHLLNGNYLPVISSLATDKQGNTYNINADIMAAEIALATSADKFLILSDIDGIYDDFSNKNSLYNEISLNQIKKGVDDNKFTNGMLPKLEACSLIINKKKMNCQIINGKIKNNILESLIFNKSIGTKII